MPRSELHRRILELSADVAVRMWYIAWRDGQACGACAGVEMDVWAVGMLAWELLTGAPAFDLEEDDEEDVRPLVC